jgi:gliding motility-associated-like protein
MKSSLLRTVLFFSLIIFSFHVKAQYAINGDARRDTGECFVLTPNQLWQGGSVWYLNRVNIGTAFDLHFEIFLGCREGGADGIAFVLQQVSTSVGTQGGGLGYEGIRPSLAVEFDTWTNQVYNDPFFDHVSIQANGDPSHQTSNRLAGPVPILPGNGNIEDCQFHKLRITWDPATSLFRVYVDCVLRLSYSGNIISQIFRNNPNVFWGFTASTGGERNLQVFCRDFVSFFQQSQDTSICRGESIRLDVGQGDTIRWTPSTGLSSTTIANPIASPDTTTTYTVTIKDECGDTRVATIRVQVDPLPDISAGEDTVVCGGVPVRLQATGGIGYQWSPTIGLNNPTIASPLVNPTQTTVYTVTGRDLRGCEASDEVLVEIFNADAGSDLTTCPGDSVRLQSRLNGNSYQWFPSAGLSNPLAGQPNALPQATTDYILLVRHPSGCSDRDTVRISLLPQPELSILPEAAEICPGDSVILEADMANLTGILWTPGASLSSTISPRTTARPVTTTTYTAIGRDRNGCQDTAQITVVVGPPPTVDAGRDTVQCGDIPIRLQATGGVQYSWSPAASLQNPNTADPFANPDTSTTYVVTVTDANGCVNQDSVFVRAFNADAGPDVEVCIGDTPMLMAPPQGIRYFWQRNIGYIGPVNILNPRVYIEQDQDYIFVAFDTTGCSARDTARVIVNPLPTTNVSSPAPYVCSDGAAVLTATGGVQYAWTPAATLDDSTLAAPTARPINLGPDIVDSTWYYVTVTDANGCSDIDSIGIEVRLRPVIEVSGDTFVCPGDTVPIWVQGGFGVQRAGWRFDGSVADSTLITQTRAEGIAFPNRGTYYVGVVEAIWGCTNEDSIWVYHIEPYAGEDSTICEGDSLRLLGAGGVRYRWHPPTGLSNAAVAQPWAFPRTTTTYTLTVTDSLGCVDSDEVTITVRPAPPIEITGDTEICINDEAALFANGGIAYQWFTEDTTISSLTAPNVTAAPRRDMRYILLGEGSNGCFWRDTLDLEVHPLPEVQAGPPANECRNTPVQLQGSGAVDYSWTPQQFLDDPFAQNPIATPDSTQYFYLTGTDANGCVNYDSVYFRVIQLPQVRVSDDDSICLYQSASFRAQGIVNRFEWSTGEETERITVSPRESTTYWVIGYNREGCAADTLFVDLYVEQNLPRAAFSPEIEEGFPALEVPLINESQNASRFRWYYGNGDTSSTDLPVHSYTYFSEGQYTVSLVADNAIGCPDSVAFSFIDVWGEELFLPTAFTPNGDGTNDEYYVPNGGFQTFEVQIFNRWGRRIYQSNEPNFRWRGHDAQGRAVPEGVYVINVVGRTWDGIQRKQNGTITVLR